jgi:predicted RNA-binding protein
MSELTDMESIFVITNKKIFGERFGNLNLSSYIKRNKKLLILNHSYEEFVIVKRVINVSSTINL